MTANGHIRPPCVFRPPSRCLTSVFYLTHLRHLTLPFTFARLTIPCSCYSLVSFVAWSPRPLIVLDSGNCDRHKNQRPGSVKCGACMYNGLTPEEVETLNHQCDQQGLQRIVSCKEILRPSQQVPRLIHKGAGPAPKSAVRTKVFTAEIGNTAELRSDGSHNWKVFVRERPDSPITSVKCELHPTFPDPIQDLKLRYTAACSLATNGLSLCGL